MKINLELPRLLEKALKKADKEFMKTGDPKDLAKAIQLAQVCGLYGGRLPPDYQAVKVWPRHCQVV